MLMLPPCPVVPLAKNRGRKRKTACGDVHIAAGLTAYIHGSARVDPVGAGDRDVAAFRVGTFRLNGTLGDRSHPHLQP